MTTTTEDRAEVKVAQGYFGRAMKRVEDPRLIKGIATYVDDLKLPGVLHAEFVRSPHAHANILSINTDAAKRLPGVVGVFTGADINDKVGRIPCAAPIGGGKTLSHMVLAGARVYFVGHAVAVVVAETRTIARDALDLVEVDYEPLPAVTDPEKALEAGSALTHPELGTNVAFTWNLHSGDLEGAFNQADNIIKVRMIHPRLTPMALEPRGCAASWHAGESSLTLWTSTQIPHLVRTLLPGLISIPENKLRVVTPEVGGGFGSKLNLYAEEAVVSHLAMRLNRPIKWIEGRRENASSTIHGRDQIGDHEIAVKKDGTLLAVRTKLIADVGSYWQLLTPAIPTLTGTMHCGCYKLKAVHVDITGVHTNKMPTDVYRGAGRPEAAYIIERIMDLVAGELGLDPVQVRLKNMPEPTEFPFTTATGLNYDSGNYQAALKKAQDLAAWPKLLEERAAARKAGHLFGIGPSKTIAAGGWESEGEHCGCKTEKFFIPSLSFS